MAGLTPLYFTAAPGVFVCVNVDATKYDGEIRTAVGASTTEPPANSVVFFISERAARRSGAVKLLKLGVRKGTKYRQVPLLCDREKAISALSALNGKKIKLGFGLGVDWDIRTVNGG
ncbi:MAG: hypothetical protein NW214_08635 [Pseudanabaenaceae cyanobacterium bins.39]|nr:hypothetical protein [Pseudanabaenaceae cyanobacterium bins.39]